MWAPRPRMSRKARLTCCPSDASYKLGGFEFSWRANSYTSPTLTHLPPRKVFPLKVVNDCPLINLPELVWSAPAMRLRSKTSNARVLEGDTTSDGSVRVPEPMHQGAAGNMEQPLLEPDKKVPRVVVE